MTVLCISRKGNIFLFKNFSLTVPKNIKGCKYKKKRNCTQQKAKHSYLLQKQIKMLHLQNICNQNLSRYSEQICTF